MGGSRNIAIGYGAPACSLALALAASAAAHGRRAGGPADRRRPRQLCRRRDLRRHHLPRPQRGDGPVVRQDEIDALAGSGDRRRRAQPRLCGASRAARRARSPQRLGIGEATGAPMCLGCHATPGRARAASASRPPTASAAKAATAPPRAGCRAIMRSAAPTPPTSRAASSRSKIRAARAASCLDCHFGSADREGQFVTHRIMAAGHPRISFELDLFSTLQQHHNDRRRLCAAQGPSRTAPRIWAIGQAMALRALARPCSRSARGTRGHLPRILFLRLPQLPPPDLRRSPLPADAARPIRAGRSRRACRPTMTRT